MTPRCVAIVVLMSWFRWLCYTHAHTRKHTHHEAWVCVRRRGWDRLGRPPQLSSHPHAAIDRWCLIVLRYLAYLPGNHRYLRYYLDAVGTASPNHAAYEASKLVI